MFHEPQWDASPGSPPRVTSPHVSPRTLPADGSDFSPGDGDGEGGVGVPGQREAPSCVSLPDALVQLRIELYASDEGR